VYKITPGLRQPLYSVAQTRQLEHRLAADLPDGTLMQRAGLAVARLALALAPHAQRIWIACGPGNNGGDGLEAAVHLLRWGKSPLVTWLGDPDRAPADTRAAFARFAQAGLSISPTPPADPDFCIDALLGIGADARPPAPQMADWMQQLRAHSPSVLAIDIPSGLSADNGRVNPVHVRAGHTLSLLTLKPGLFTHQGRDTAGSVWFDALGTTPQDAVDLAPVAHLPATPFEPARLHASHKGSYGDVAVVGGARGMTGAALMAATAALHSGCGRVFVSLLDDRAGTLHPPYPELMFRPLDELDWSRMSCVFGCGAGQLPENLVRRVLACASPLVIDADGLNAIAACPALQEGLAQRGARQQVTVLTPHPLEAARLLNCPVSQIQGDRLQAAQQLMQKWGCTVVLKGSGSVIATPGQTPVINTTGNARLATAGSGDVLAGMIGAALAKGFNAFDAACWSVFRHGAIADRWPDLTPLTAGALARSPQVV